MTTHGGYVSSGRHASEMTQPPTGPAPGARAGAARAINLSGVVIEAGDLAIWCVGPSPSGEALTWAADTGQFEGIGSRHCGAWDDWVNLALKILDTDRTIQQLNALMKAGRP